MSSQSLRPRVLAFDLDSYASGAQRSFAALLRELVAGGHASVLALVGDGPIVDEFVASGLPVVRTTETLHSVRIGPTAAASTARDVLRLARVVRRAAAAFDADLIHANSVRSGVVALFATLLGGPPVVVHVRDHFHRTTAAVVARAFVLTRAAAVLAVSDYTARRFALPGCQQVTTVYNAIDEATFYRTKARGSCRRTVGEGRPEVFVIGVVAQITPWKAQDDAIRILRQVRDSGVDAVLWLVGEAKRPAHMAAGEIDQFVEELRHLADELDVSDSVWFLGQRPDIPDLLDDMDVVLIPSWEEPFARTLIEAMTIGTPALVTSASGMGEVLEHGKTGLLAPPRRPDLWAQEITRLALDPSLRKAMARDAKRVARARFTTARQAEEVLAVYSSALQARRRILRWPSMDRRTVKVGR